MLAGAEHATTESAFRGRHRRCTRYDQRPHLSARGGLGQRFRVVEADFRVETGGAHFRAAQRFCRIPAGCGQSPSLPDRFHLRSDGRWHRRISKLKREFW